MEYDRYDRFREGKCHSSSICSPRDSPRQNELHRRGGDGGGEVSSTSLFRGRFLNANGQESTATWMYPKRFFNWNFQDFFLRFESYPIGFSPKYLCLMRRPWRRQSFTCFFLEFLCSSYVWNRWPLELSEKGKVAKLLLVATHLKNISQIGNLSQMGTSKIIEPQPRLEWAALKGVMFFKHSGSL